MQFRQTSIPGCFEIIPNVFHDERGYFVKTFQHSVYASQSLETEFVEHYYSITKKGVIRGLHFQAPPADLSKLVFCTTGKIFDAVLDLRVGSPTYLKFEVFELSALESNMIYLPAGCAHGFQALVDGAQVHYKVTAEYSPDSDTGVLWNSAGVPWPLDCEGVSRRDASFQKLDEFKSPFDFPGNTPGGLK